MTVKYKDFYYMACSASRQDETNPVFCLASQVGKMDNLGHLGLSVLFP